MDVPEKGKDNGNTIEEIMEIVFSDQIKVFVRLYNSGYAIIFRNI